MQSFELPAVSIFMNLTHSSKTQISPPKSQPWHLQCYCRLLTCYCVFLPSATPCSCQAQYPQECLSPFSVLSWCCQDFPQEFETFLKFSLQGKKTNCNKNICMYFFFNRVGNTLTLSFNKWHLDNGTSTLETEVALLHHTQKLTQNESHASM